MSGEDMVNVTGATLLAGAVTRSFGLDPIQATLISFALGYLVGRFLSRKAGAK